VTFCDRGFPAIAGKLSNAGKQLRSCVEGPIATDVDREGRLEPRRDVRALGPQERGPLGGRGEHEGGDRGGILEEMRDYREELGSGRGALAHAGARSERGATLDTPSSVTGRYRHRRPDTPPAPLLPRRWPRARRPARPAGARHLADRHLPRKGAPAGRSRRRAAGRPSESRPEERASVGGRPPGVRYGRVALSDSAVGHLSETSGVRIVAAPSREEPECRTVWRRGPRRFWISPPVCEQARTCGERGSAA
jgi:hypothetical protein